MAPPLPLTRKQHADQDADRDEDIGTRVRRVGDEQLAGELVPPAVFVPGDEDVRGERREQQGEAGVAHPHRMPAGHETADGAADQLKAGDRKEDDDGERAERFELAVSVGVLFVGLA